MSPTTGPRPSPRAEPPCPPPTPVTTARSAQAPAPPWASRAPGPPTTPHPPASPSTAPAAADPIRRAPAPAAPRGQRGKPSGRPQLQYRQRHPARYLVLRRRYQPAMAPALTSKGRDSTMHLPVSQGHGRRCWLAAGAAMALASAALTTSSTRGQAAPAGLDV